MHRGNWIALAVALTFGAGMWALTGDLLWMACGLFVALFCTI